MKKVMVAKFPRKIREALEKFPRIKSTYGICSSMPCVSGRRIPAWIIASRYACGEGMNSIAKDYEITGRDVLEAIRFSLWIGGAGNISFWKFYKEVSSGASPDDRKGE